MTASMIIRALVSLPLIACAGSESDTPGQPDAPVTPGCVVGISNEVLPPFASASTFVRAVANVQNSPGQHSYIWFLSFNGGPNQTPAPAAIDGSAVEFPATQPGIYRVRFRIEDPECEEADTNIEVNDPGAGTTVLRIHVVAPPEVDRPPVDKLVLVQGGAVDLIDDIQLAPAVSANGTVVAGGSPAAAYLKFMPVVGADAIVETYSSAIGTYSTTLRAESHSVLVIPTTPGIAPQIVTWSPGLTTLELQQGIALSGTVRTPANTALAGASVQLTVDGVPSTIATTDGAGAFTLLAASQTGKVRFEVTPPPATGLPRLIAESALLTVADGLEVLYTPSLASRDLAGTVIQRSGALPNAAVTIVGTLPNAGTISGLVAIGEARFSAVTNGSGVLPTLRVPAAPLHAVVFPGAVGDHAITAIDLTSAVPATITAVATITRTTQLTSAGTGLPGAVLDAVPTGPLALAGAPTIRKVAGANGSLTIELAPNALYDMRLSDPNGNRGASVIVGNQSTANLPAVSALAKATKVQATVVGSGPIPGAIVQFLCANCTGIERSRPIAEGVTGVDGRFSLAVPDPN